MSPDTSPSARERQAAVAALLEAGPHEPTLCEGWDTHDLAAHLVAREHKPAASLGMAVPALSGWTERTRLQYRERPFAELVELVRTGPPRLSPFSLPGVDGAANLVEYFVHTEDVRRGATGWSPRELPAQIEEALWRQLSLTARLALRRSPVPVRLVRADGAEIATGRAGVPVRLEGDVGELVLYVSGRTGACQVSVDGPPEAVDAFRALDLGL